MRIKDPTIAGKCIKQGGIVIFPTETVYGIGASAYDHAACQKIYRIKQRPQDNPLILHVASIDAISDIAYVPDYAFPLIERWMPGPLTLILSKRDHRLFTADLPTVAIRIPALPLAQQLLVAAEGPVAAPSANISGKPSITRYRDAVDQFETYVDMILEGPDSTIGIESTVIDLSGPTPLYLRPGAISFEEICSLIPSLSYATNHHAPSPGLKYRHYSPACEVILVDSLENIELANAGQIGFHLAHRSQHDVKVVSNEEYTRELFAFFIDCDHLQLKKAYCQHPLPGPLQAALLNRITKACSKV